MATFTETPVDDAANPNVLWEPANRPAQYLMWESNADYCRTVVEVDNTAGTKPILPGTVLRKANGDFKGILFGRPLIAGLKEDRTVTHRGPCIVRDEKLIFPKVTDAPDGADPGSDNTAENAAATAALEATLRAAMAAAGIDIQ